MSIVVVCGAVCADDPKSEYPCVERPLHSCSHKDSRGWTWGLSNNEIAASARTPEERAQAARRADYWRQVQHDDSNDDDDGVFDDDDG